MSLILTGVTRYSDIKTSLSQVELNWDWPTVLSLAITAKIVNIPKLGVDFKKV